MWEVSWRLNRLQLIDPQVPLSLAALLSHSAGLLNRGSWGPKPYTGSWFSLPRTTTKWLQLTRTVCGTRLYHCLTRTCFLRASHLHRIQPVHMSRWYLDRIHLFLDWRLGQSVTIVIDAFRKRTGWVGNRRTGRDHPDYSIAEIDNCCIVARTTWLPVLRKYKRRRVFWRTKIRKRSREIALKDVGR